ncbi:MAG TPA: hypothetical protein PLG43_06005, partial [Spirochaetia bacterium]|nr:hypothetical protein [Spirochaetia bacterium]
MKRLWIPLLFTVSILSLICSCTLPPYSDELSFAEVTAKKMEKVLSFGPLSMDDSGAINYHFIPDKVMAPTGGFFLIERSSSLDVRYIAQEGGPDEWKVYSGNGFELIPNENNFRFFPAALKPYAYQNTWMALYPYSVGVSDTLLSFSFTGSFQVNEPLPLKSDVEGVVGPIDNIVGLSVYPNADSSTDRLHILGRVGTSYVEVAYSSLDTSGYINPEDINSARGLSSQIAPEIDGAANGFYFYDPATMRSFLSVYRENSRAYRNYSWYESGGTL